MSVAIRPHHLLGILRDHGYGIRYEPHEYGHALHTVADKILNNLDSIIVFVNAADDVCRPCKHLHINGRCDDTMQLGCEIVSKQIYNDGLDRRLWAYFNLDRGNRMTVRDFLTRVQDRLDGLEALCAHPGEDRKYRKMGLVEGLKKLGFCGEVRPRQS